MNIASETIAQEVQGMATFMPNGEILRKRTPGFILDRAGFDKALAMDAFKAAAYINGDKEAIETYFDQWRNKFGGMLDRATKKRDEMDAGWGEENLTRLLKRCWIAYGEYYDKT